MNKFNYGNQACRFFDGLYNKKSYDQFLRYDNLIRQFKKTFGGDYCYLASSSGRVELVGNHTDHNGGKVIGCAIDLDVVAAFRLNDSAVVRIASDNHSLIEYSVEGAPQLSGGFGVAEGVTTYLKNNGYKVGGFDAFTHSTVLSGAGISSSAAFEMLIATIVNECFNDGAIPNEVLAKSGKHAEQIYLEKPCGLLDQGAVLTGGMTAFDFKDGFSCRKIDADVSGISLVLVDTGKSHAGLSDLYASIPAEMFSVAELLNAKRLADVDENTFVLNADKIKSELGLRPYLRARHFFEENKRVEQAEQALLRRDTESLFRIVNASGDSSRTQLQNCATDENDTAINEAVDYARSLTECGARVHGGGFAGTILCVVPSNVAVSFTQAIADKYGAERVLALSVRQVGAKVL
ncbi:MAG: hypothetical protein NC099_05330 [Corallococcus sp.]|nr:galactokinase [Bacillota bacterium]MCM1534055.1 hypothetical protein [Corallococcus sp.]